MSVARVFIISIIIFSSTIVSVNGLEIGVEQGDWILYEFKYNQDPEYEPYPTHLKIYLTKIEGDMVYTSLEFTESDGTQGNDTYNFTIGEQLILYKNMNLGEYIGGVGSGFVDQVYEKSYLGIKRKIVLTEDNFSYFYFDKRTGMLLERIYKGSDQEFSGMIIADTNIFMDDRFFGFLSDVNILGIGAGILALGAIGVILYNRYRAYFVQRRYLLFTR